MFGKNKFLSFLFVFFLFQSYLFAAYDFSGTDQYLHVTDENAVDQGTDVTVCAWIMPDTISGIDGIVNRDESTDGDRVFQFRLSDGTLQAICFVNDTTNATASSSAPVEVDVWTFVAFTFDGSNIHVFINSGTSAGTAALSGDLSAEAVGISVAARSRTNASQSNPPDDFDGTIAEPAQWNRVLSEAELNALAGNNSPQFYTTGLQWHAPLVDDYVDDTGGMTFTATGAPTQATHPEITLPSAGGYVNLIGGNFGNKLINGGLIK